MTKRLPSVLAVLLPCCLVILYQTPAYSQDIEIEITEVPYREVYAFGSPWFDFGGGHEVTGNGETIDASYTGMGLRIWGARQDRDIQLQLAIGFNQYRIEELEITDLTSISVLDMMWGGRYYPRYPTFGLGGRLAARATFFAEGGLAMGTNPSFFAPVAVIGAGFAVSSWDNPSGVMLEIVYRPLTQDVTYEYDTGFPDYNTVKSPLTLNPSWNVRLAFVIAP
ncbi:hypothetical protein ACFL3H_08620 [Gemmatimonadota bacterium]